MSHVRLINKVPDHIFASALSEVVAIDWDNLPPLPGSDIRRNERVFSTSTANHLRVHKQDPKSPRTRAQLSEVIECVDIPPRKLYPMVNEMVSWIQEEIEFTNLGRIMIVKLDPGGSVPPHIDTGSYFQSYYRLHVPFVTNPEVVFYGEEGSLPAHMAAGYLFQLDNRRTHSVVNNSKSLHRIHLIIDIASNQKRFNL